MEAIVIKRPLAKKNKPSMHNHLSWAAGIHRFSMKVGNSSMGTGEKLIPKRNGGSNGDTLCIYLKGFF